MNITKKTSSAIWVMGNIMMLLFGFSLEVMAIPPGGALGGDRPRILVSTDSHRLASSSEGGPFEVDDHQSLVRFLLYSDVFDVEGIVHTTTISNRGFVETVEEIIDAYELDYPNLKSWASGYPTPASLRAVTVQGATWGPRAPRTSYSNAGSQLIVQKANNGDPRPLWILAFGQITDVAQALYDDPSIKNNIRIIGGFQNFALGGSRQPNDDIHAISWIQNNHPDLYFIESIETLKATAFPHSGFTLDDGNRFLSEHGPSHGALGNHMWDFRRQDANGNPDPVTGWFRLGDDPTLNYLLSGESGNPTGEHWGGRFQNAHDPVSPNLYKDLTSESAAHASARKHHLEWLDHFAKRLDRARYFNEIGNSDFQRGRADWVFSPGATVAWVASYESKRSTLAGKLALSAGVTPSIEQIVSVSGGNFYTISGWMKPLSVKGTSVKMQGYWQTSGGEVPASISADFSLGNGAWAYIWRQLMAPIDATGLRIAMAAGGPGTGEVYFDDISIVKGALPRPAGLGSQLLNNGGFTHNMQGWGGYRASVDWATGHLGDSTKVGKLRLSPSSYSTISQSIPIVHGQAYTVTAWINPISIAGTTVKMWAYWQTPNGQLATSVSSNLISGNSDWSYAWKQIVAPANATALRVSIEAGLGTGEVFIDEVEVWGPKG